MSSPIKKDETMREGEHFCQILGITFFVGSAQEVVDEILRGGGLVVVPSGPGLETLPYDEQYRRALLGSDFALADSALMVLLWNLIQKKRIRKLSGLTYLRELIKRKEFREPGASFWVMPTYDAVKRNVEWLQAEGVEVSQEDVYLAPIYRGKIADAELLKRLEEQRPRHIVLGVGGGTQEPLGFYLRENLTYRPAIHCIGAAIGFITGDQVRIPAWADRIGLGWFWRCLSNPRRYVPRYWEARHLVPLMLRYQDRLPATISR